MQLKKSKSLETELQGVFLWTLEVYRSIEVGKKINRIIIQNMLWKSSTWLHLPQRSLHLPQRNEMLVNRKQQLPGSQPGGEYL